MHMGNLSNDRSTKPDLKEKEKPTQTKGTTTQYQKGWFAMTGTHAPVLRSRQPWMRVFNAPINNRQRIGLQNFADDNAHSLSSRAPALHFRDKPCPVLERGIRTLGL